MKKENIIYFVPEDTPLPDEIEAIKNADEEINNTNLVSHEEINWN